VILTLLLATTLLTANYDEDVQALTATPHRMAGTAEGERAGNDIETELRKLPGEVFVQRFSFPQQITTTCELRTATGIIPLQPLAANGLQPSVGTITNGIVVADFNSRGTINDAFRQGANAIIFVGDDKNDRLWLADKRTFITADIPRFYVSRKNAGDLTGTIVSQVEWQPRTGRNIFLWIPGTMKKEFVILSAYYDSEGIVPENSPSPAAAANCAALLETARRLAAHPPQRSVLIAFFDNHANFMEGGRQFYAAYRRSIPERIEDPLPVRLRYVREERAYLKEILARPHFTQELLRDAAKQQYERCQEQLTLARLKHENTDALKQQQQSWQRIRECVRDGISPPDTVEFREMLGAIRTRLERRLRELDVLETQLNDSVALTAPLAGLNPVGHVALRFTGGNSRWLFVPRGFAHERWLANLLDKAQVADNSRTTPLAFVNWLTKDESSFAAAFEIPSLTAVTEQDRAPSAWMPDSVASPAELANIRQQAQELQKFVDVLANDPAASVPNRVVQRKRLRMDDYRWQDNEPVGHQVKSFEFGQTAAGRIEPNAIVHILGDQYRQLQVGAQAGPVVDDRWTFGAEYVTYADANGCFPLTTIADIDYLPHESAWGAVLIEAAQFGPDGRVQSITTASPHGGLGSVSAGWSSAGYYRFKEEAGFYSILNMFSGPGGLMFGETLPFGARWRPIGFHLLNGLSNAQYKRLHFRFDPLTGRGAYYIDRPEGVKVVYQDPQNEDAVALCLTPKFDRIDLRAVSAPDMIALDETRLQTLRRKNILLNSVEYIHSLAQQATNFSLAGALERRVYRPVMAVTNDMVVAVTMLLLLAIPFAFALQNLLLWTYDVYRRIGYFMLFFLLTFGVLYMVHPAFSFAATPTIILLAFVVLVMSGGVIWIIGDKFVYEVKKMQGLAAAAHTMERSLFGNVGAAVSLAISIMRRRPARTALTVVTVIFLTFTILSFVSFQTEKGVNKYRLEAGDQTSRLLVRRNVWKSMDRQVLQDLQQFLGPDHAAHGRYWRSKELTVKVDPAPFSIPVARPDGRTAIAGAILSLDPIELRFLPDLLLTNVDRFAKGEGVYLPAKLATELNAQPGDTLRIQGVNVALLGTFDPQRLSKLREVDGSPMLPVNFAAAQMALGRFEAKGSAGSTDKQADLEEALTRLEPEALEPVSPDTVILAPTALESLFGMALKGVIVYPKAGTDIDQLAERIAVLRDESIYVNQGGERARYHYGNTYSVTGVTDVAIPLVLGGLIIFSTMLGSVIDRQKEIYTFSALGLAPRNIAMLFFVEAAIYAVVGGFGGYLFSQVVTAVLQTLAAHGLFRAPEINYSSSTAINTILIVMATVIVSTIYPAIQAARKATADTARQWKIPAAVGDVCDFDFPFTISQYDITGILCFLREHFANHADRTVGEFAVDNVELQREPRHGFAGLRATIWLQPFDQGISQRFEITAQLSDIEEVCAIHVRIERLSGPPAAWTRANKLFLEDIRRQFLLWRTLDDEERDQYLAVAAETEKAWAPV